MIIKLLKNIGDKHFVWALIVVGLIACNHSLVAQVHNNGVLHINENTTFYVHSETITFGVSPETTTSKNAPYATTDGKIMLGSGATFTTDGTAKKFVNGYAGTFNTAETTLAIGDNLVYAPIKVTATTNNVLTNKNVHATYFNSVPPSIANKDALVTAIADTEYWIVKGENAILSLSWRASSSLNTITASLAGVTIVGFNTDDNEWQVIDSTPEPGATLTTGFIKSSNPINLADYSAFAIGEKGVDCFPIVIASNLTRTWDGSDWDITPTIYDNATLTGSYNGLGFKCYTLALGSNNVTLTGGTLEVVEHITGTGKIILDENDGLVQHIGTATKPQIELTRTTRTMKRFDYVYWGSPVVEDVYSDLNNNAIATASGSSSGAFDYKYKYVSGTTSGTGGWQTLSETNPGKGFIMRVKQQAPFVDGTSTGTINLKFTGTANNGDVEVAVAKVDGNNNSARNNNLLANPYPSAIDAEKFLIENNSLVDGVIYLWRANTININGAATSYNNADYIAYTKAGAQTYSGDPTTEFDGYIASGQGFKVRALISGDAKFTNCMRIVDNNNLFLRSNTSTSTITTPITTDRFRVSLQTANSVANQILVAYMPETTLGYDRMYDARMLTTSGTTLFSILDNDTQRLAINARPDFVNTDEVALGFTKDAAVTTPMSITIADREGVFANNQTPIYLHDTVLNTYHDFANGTYTFNTTATQDLSRFKIVYQTPQLSNEDFTADLVNVYIKDKTFNMSSSKEVASVQIFDLTGRLVATYNVNQQKTLRENFNFATAVYVAKIKFTDGNLTSKKLINQQ